VVVLNKTPEPINLRGRAAGQQQRSRRRKPDPVAICANDRTQSETAYIHSVVFNTNLMPLATRDLRSPYMDSGDYAC
jgi:hypothetical protein